MDEEIRFVETQDFVHVPGSWRFGFMVALTLPWRREKLWVDTAEQWCRENLGRHGHDRNWLRYGYCIVVRSKMRATAFKLRWC